MTHAPPGSAPLLMHPWHPVTRQIPGAHPTMPHSRFAGLAAPAVASVGGVRTDARTDPPRFHSLDLAGLWERAIDPAQALTHATAFTLPPASAPWQPTYVPQNYGIEPDLTTYFGPVWYRRPITRPHDAAYLTIEFDAVDYLADVVLNGEHLGRHEGYFTPFAFDLTERLTPRNMARGRWGAPLPSMRPPGPLPGHPPRRRSATSLHRAPCGVRRWRWRAISRATPIWPPSPTRANAKRPSSPSIRQS